ncbi:hypothetical protein CBM2599_A80044 [Cupriavidus taiwanensis]|nr:hypothetical protein CBM2599_A80044 [Cupriavidus taiwanensis]
MRQTAGDETPGMKLQAALQGGEPRRTRAGQPGRGATIRRAGGAPRRGCPHRPGTPLIRRGSPAVPQRFPHFFDPRPA